MLTFLSVVFLIIMQEAVELHSTYINIQYYGMYVRKFVGAQVIMEIDLPK